MKIKSLFSLATAAFVDSLVVFDGILHRIFAATPFPLKGHHDATSDSQRNVTATFHEPHGWCRRDYSGDELY